VPAQSPSPITSDFHFFATTSGAARGGSVNLKGESKCQKRNERKQPTRSFHHFPGGSKAQYEASIAALHPSRDSLPKGQIFHAAGASAGGWTVVAVHDSKASWKRFRDDIFDAPNAARDQRRVQNAAAGDGSRGPQLAGVTTGLGSPGLVRRLRHAAPELVTDNSEMRPMRPTSPGRWPCRRVAVAEDDRGQPSRRPGSGMAAVDRRRWIILQTRIVQPACAARQAEGPFPQRCSRLEE